MKITQHEYTKAKRKLDTGKTPTQVYNARTSTGPSTQTLGRIQKSKDFADYQRICQAEGRANRSRQGRYTMKPQPNVMNVLETSAPKPKRKKFLGIF